MKKIIEVLRAGVFTSIQDLKRVGFKRYGIPKSGPMDQYSHLLANWLVGNKLYSETIEVTFLGPKIKFLFDTKIGLCGTKTSIFLNEKKIEMNKTLTVNSGDILDIKSCSSGNRVYLSIKGEMKLTKDFDSLSTYDKVNIGGVNGRKLIKGDKIEFKERKFNENRIIPEILRKNQNERIVRVIKGPEYHLVDRKSMEKSFTISPISDRMGIRLSNNRIKLKSNSEIESSVVTEGTIQLPPDGNPIILMRDAQTTGGYPRIGIVCKVDISKLSQIKANQKIKLKFITLNEAEILIQHEVKKIRSKLKINLTS